MFPSTTKDSANSTPHDHELRERIVDAADQAGRKVRSLYDSASAEVEHAGDRVTSEIRTNPIRSTAIALGLGVALGALLRR